MKNSDLENIKKTIVDNGYNLTGYSCLLNSNYEGYEKSQCYYLTNTTIKVEFHFFDSGKDVINAVSLNIKPNQNEYFRQIAVGKIWLIFKGDWGQQNTIDILMDKITEKI